MIIFKKQKSRMHCFWRSKNIFLKSQEKGQEERPIFSQDAVSQDAVSQGATEAAIWLWTNFMDHFSSHYLKFPLKYACTKAVWQPQGNQLPNEKGPLQWKSGDSVITCVNRWGRNTSTSPGYALESLEILK